MRSSQYRAAVPKGLSDPSGGSERSELGGFISEPSQGTALRSDTNIDITARCLRSVGVTVWPAKT